MYLGRLPSDDAQALQYGAGGQRGSMVLWKLANSGDDPNDLAPPPPPGDNRFSRFSVNSGSDASLMSYSEDSKYPVGTMRPHTGLIAYAYDPFADQNEPKDEEDRLHEEGEAILKRRGFNFRGLLNVTALSAVLFAVVLLFTLYPIYTFFHRSPVQILITGNSQINSTGQFPDL